ncbi:unnamed protein product, partial [Didymodactylos carnosus]
DLSDVDQCMLNKYYQTILPKVQHYIKAIKVNDKNVDSVFPLSLYSKIYPNLESVFITKVEKDGKFLSYLKLFKQLLNLKIYFNVGEFNETVSNEFCSNLLQNDCRLQTLVFDNVYVSINTHISQLCFSIRNLTIKLHSLHDVYLLLNNLPSIEYVNIHIPRIIGREEHQQQEQNDVQFNYDKNIPWTLSKLKHFVFSSIYTANYDYLELLLSHCCCNLERLSLDLYSNEFIDGERLEKKLLSKLTKLKVFHFCFRIPILDNTLNIDDYIQTYKSSYWINNHHSILCFNQPLHNQYYCVFSLPYVFYRFSHVTNDLVNYRSNVNDDILLYSNKAKDITFCGEVSFTLELFQIIQKSCLKATELTFIEASVRFFSDNLMNNELILKNIVSVWLFLDQLEYKYFRRLLLMTPNILRLYLLQRLLLDVIRESQNKPNAFQQLQSICNPIRHVFIGRAPFEHDALNDNGIKLLFPNAKLSGWR